MSTDFNNDFYCSQKFTWLSIDVEKRLINSCCSAFPEKINLTWLKNNPGGLFRTDSLQKERRMMLDNIPVPSCEENCWKPERNNLISRRLWHKSNLKTHTNIEQSSPYNLNINLGSACNLTCSYCCKQYSSAWRRDILTNGPYLDYERFNVTDQDKILLKISQAEHLDTESYTLIKEEIKKFDQVHEVQITGGEPFLHNGIHDLINEFKKVPKVIVYTGLGVNSNRFLNQLNRIQHKENLEIVVSAENCAKFYEFNRFGNTWENFLSNLTLLEKHNFKIKFAMVISNLTIFGLYDFIKNFGYEKACNWCNDPEFLSIHVLDDDSKQHILDKFCNENTELALGIRSSISQPCTERQREDLAVYLLTFAKRRNLALDIFPDNMLKWLKIKT